MTLNLSHLDHFVLTVADIDASCAFYEQIGMRVVTFGAGRNALQFGSQKINLHQKGQEFEPKAAAPTAGSGDFCLISTDHIETVIAHLQKNSLVIEDGPVGRTGAMGAITSVYLRDPDRNLVEIAVYGSGPTHRPER